MSDEKKRVHLSPHALGEAIGKTFDEVVDFCREHGIPIYKGEIDRDLYDKVEKGIAAEQNETTGKGEQESGSGGGTTTATHQKLTEDYFLRTKDLPPTRADGEPWSECPVCHNEHPTVDELIDIIAGRLPIKEDGLYDTKMTMREMLSIEFALRNFNLEQTVMGMEEGDPEFTAGFRETMGRFFEQMCEYTGKGMDATGVERPMKEDPGPDKK